MRTREEIETDLMYFAERANVSHDTSEYQEYINRMQLDLLMDIRDALTTRTAPDPISSLNRMKDRYK